MALDLSLAIGDRGLRSFALAFAITQIVEVPVYSRALRSQASRSGRARSLPARAAIGFGASAITHPIVWFAMPAIAMAMYAAAVRAGAPELGGMGRTLFYGALAEGLAVLVEAAYLRAFGVRRALLWSIGANGASVLVGTLAVWAIG